MTRLARLRCIRAIGAPTGTAPVRQCDFHRDGGPAADKCPYYCDRGECRRARDIEIDGAAYCRVCAALVLLEKDGFAAELDDAEFREIDAIVEEFFYTRLNTNAAPASTTDDSLLGPAGSFFTPMAREFAGTGPAPTDDALLGPLARGFARFSRACPAARCVSAGRCLNKPGECLAVRRSPVRQRCTKCWVVYDKVLAEKTGGRCMKCGGALT